jgi:hypothetical protein
MAPVIKTESDLLAQLLATLQRLPEVTARLRTRAGPSRGASRANDVELEVNVSGTAVAVVVELKKTAFPREVRQLLGKLGERGASIGRGARRGATVHLLAAESIAPGAKQLLRDEGIGYFDSGGSLFLPAKGAYLLLEKPAPKSQARVVRSLFTGRRAQVLQVLLHRPREWVNGKVLAEQAMVSAATVSGTLAALERFDWVVARGKGPAKERNLAEPGALLDAWVAQVAAEPPPLVSRYFVPAASSDQLLERLAQACQASQAGYAVTAEAAAQRYAPWLSSVSQVRCWLLAGAPANAALGALGARPVDEGANLVVHEAKSSGDLLLRERVGGAWLASPVQVYLDLLRGEGRSREAAAHLRKERIGF